jgi:putative ABC transport system permease protein
VRRLRALRALLRVELRDALRNRARSWLVVSLVALGMAAMVGGGALFRTARATPHERCASVLGEAALRVHTYDALTRGEFERLIPAGARVAAFSEREAVLRAGSRQASSALWSFEPDALDAGGLAHGMLRVLEGRAPRDAGEIALSRRALEELGVERGAAVELDGRSHAIVGVVALPEQLASSIALVAFAPEQKTRQWLVHAPPERQELLGDELHAAGHGVQRRSELGQGDGFEQLVTFVLGGFAFFEVALVIGAIFAVGLRRRQREIGLVGANGATAGDIVGALWLATLTLAALGVLLGTLAGAGSAFALGPWLDEWNGRWNGAVELSAAHIAGGAALGIASALLATVLPAIAAARLPIVVALSGRRPVATASRTWLALGVALLSAGGLWMALGLRAGESAAAASVLGGSIAGVLGLGACSPWLLGVLSRGAGPLPFAWRLAARDAARFRARNGPVVTAVLAALSVSIALASLAGSVDELVAAQAREVSAGADRELVGIAIALSALTGLIVVLIATALATTESSADARVLDAVGATPNVLRTVAGARAGYLALLGALLAAPAGLLPSWGLVELADAKLAFHTPWRVLAAFALGFPVLAFLGAWLGAAGAPPHSRSH